MRLYAESSAVLAWLFGEPAGERVREVLAAAELILTSDLTLVECDRVLIRAQMFHHLAEAQAVGLRTRLSRPAAHWNLLRVDCRGGGSGPAPFPGEPIRALVARAAIEGVEMLNLDRRVRTAGEQLGLNVLPS